MRASVRQFGTILAIYLTLSCFCLLPVSVIAQESGKLHTLIVIFDGLRPDYITPELMPNVHALKKSAVYGAQSHSVFPTVTRVNASSYATGSYPARHGILGNTVYFPQVNKIKGLDTGDAATLKKVEDATKGNLLTAISLGEILQKQDERLMVFSSGSTGQAFLQHHKVGNGLIVNPSLILPEEMKPEVIKAVGPIPEKGMPNSAQHTWVTDALLHYSIKSDGPMVSAIWYSDPDGTAHEEGIGAALSQQSIREVDEQFGRILDSLKTRGLQDNYNIIISADHGFVTYAGTSNLTEFLIKAGLKKSPDADDVVIAGGAIYIKGHNQALIRNIVQALQQQEWIGALFTAGAKPGAIEGKVKGTLSFETIHWNHPERAADILVDLNWSDEPNSNGYPGTSQSKGVAGHGSSSRYEIHIPFIAAGPSFKKAYESNFPTSNVDIVPTILKAHQLPIPVAMDGRVLSELMIGQPETSKEQLKTETLEVKSTTAGITYELMLERTVIGGHSYVNYTRVKRSTKR